MFVIISNYFDGFPQFGIHLYKWLLILNSFIYFVLVQRVHQWIYCFNRLIMNWNKRMSKMSSNKNYNLNIMMRNWRPNLYFISFKYEKYLSPHPNLYFTNRCISHKALCASQSQNAIIIFHLNSLEMPRCIPKIGEKHSRWKLRLLECQHSKIRTDKCSILT